MSPAADLRTLLPTLLAGLERPGEYCATGVVELPVVRIGVAGVGTLGLPIPTAQCEALAAVAGPAPYGRGPDTLVDPTVRRCGQISAQHVQAEDARWTRTLDTIVQAAAAGLGVPDRVSAELYKLLVYQPGDFFTEHRDTEKAPGMFATLVIVLPTEHVGGELVVRHDGRSCTLNLAGDDLGTASWAAFYADCQHELRPVRAGHRIALIYNLVRPKGRPPVVPDNRPVIARVATALRAWTQDASAPAKLVHPLKHQYSLTELSFSNLKNEDAAAAVVLTAAARESDCVLRLAMVSIVESGAAEAIWYGHSRGRRGRYESEDNDEEYEVIEVMEHHQRLDTWHTPDDRQEALGPIPFDDDEVSPPGALADEEPDEDHFYENSGNEGASFERSYRRAALVLWPSSGELRVLHQAGPEASVAVLERLIDADLGRATAMAVMVVDGWPRPPGADPARGTLRAQLIKALTRLSDPTPLRVFLAEVVAAGAFDGAEAAAVVTALSRFEAEIAGDLLTRLVLTCGVQRFAPVTNLLRRAAGARPGLPYASAVAAALETIPQIGEGGWPWTRTGSEVELRAAALADLAEAIGAVGDHSIAEALVDKVLATPDRWSMDEVVVPAVLLLTSSALPASRVVFQGLRAAALEHLRARIALPLAPPSDAARSAEGLDCACGTCVDLRAFLRSPILRTFTVKAAKAHRGHVESQIQTARIDLDLRTDARGNPHSLICTKNRASYERRVTQRAADEAVVAQLR